MSHGSLFTYGASHSKRSACLRTDNSCANMESPQRNARLQNEEPMTSPLRLATPRPRYGLHWELYFGHKVHYAIRQDGSRIPLPGVPIGLETEQDVIDRLAVALYFSDRSQRPARVSRAPRVLVLPLPSAQPRRDRSLASR